VASRSTTRTPPFYLSKLVVGEYEVETWRTPNGGSTSQRQSVTAGSSLRNVRPISPRGPRSFAR
jgi:hypothetical protein